MTSYAAVTQFDIAPYLTVYVNSTGLQTNLHIAPLVTIPVSSGKLSLTHPIPSIAIICLKPWMDVSRALCV